MEVHEKLPFPKSRFVGHPLEQCLFMASYWSAFSQFFQDTFSPLTALALCAIIAISYVASLFTFLFLDVKFNWNKPLGHLTLSRARMLYSNSKVPANSCCFKGKQCAL